MRLRWLDSLSVGIVQIDDEHRSLIDAANALAALPGERADAALATFIDRIRQHFQTEEGVLRRLGYKPVESHARMHREFLNSFHRVCGEMRKAPRQFDIDSFRPWLFSWFVDQVLAEDLQFKSFVMSATGRDLVRCRCIDLAACSGGCRNYGVGR